MTEFGLLRARCRERGCSAIRRHLAHVAELKNRVTGFTRR
jgi:hypothetical protein